MPGDTAKRYSVVPYDPREHLCSTLNLIADMAASPGSQYPGRHGGNSSSEHHRWLESIPLTQRWVAVDNNGVVHGHVALSPAGHSGQIVGVAPHTPEVTRLFVAPGTRRQGLATRLLAHATAAGEELHGNLILLVSDYLKDAIALYERCGWQHAGEKTSVLSGDRMLLYIFPPRP